MPACSPDSKTVLYAGADARLEKVSIDGGAPQVWPGYPDFSHPTFSPDGKLAALITQIHGAPREKLALVPLDFSQAPRFVDFEKPPAEYATFFGDDPVIFHGDGIVYAVRDGDTDNLWLQHLDGSPGKQVTDFKSEFIRDFSYSPDGKQIAIIRGHREADVVLIRDSGK
jgi:Tol biopolymer transport system component